jgi:hypothetical protein
MRKWRFLILALVLLPLAVEAETVTWTAPTLWVDGTTVSAADKALYVYYLRTWKASSPTVLTYFGETRGGVTTWSDNVMVKANQWGASVAGWVPYKAGDNVVVAVSTSWEPTDGTPSYDSWNFSKPAGAQMAWTIPGGVVVPFPTATFAAAPASIVKGSCSILSWSSTNATVASIDQGVGSSVGVSGTKSVCPVATTTYTLMAMGAGGTTVKTAIVTVTTPPVVTPGCTPPTGVTITK